MKRSSMIHRAVVETLELRRLLSLSAPVYSTVGTNPQAVAAGDLNGDGFSDVVTANAGANSISVLLGNASGALQPAQHFAAGDSPQSVAVGDVSGDGKPDVVTANRGSWNVSVLLGDGNGTLQPPQNWTLPPRFPPGYTDPTPVPQVPQSVVVGDLNADGKLDLVIDGRTTFYVPYISPYGGTTYWPQHHDHVNVMISTGGGSFSPASTYTLPNLISGLAVGDFNGDTKLDVVAPNGGVTFLAGDGSGALQAPAISGAAYGQPIAGDFDGDGELDLIVHSGSISFVKGLGNGTFGIAQPYYAHGSVRSLVAGDMNADGKLDLVASTSRTIFASYGYYGGYEPTTREYTKVLLGVGDGTFSRGVSTTVRSYDDFGPDHNNATALGDLNADGLPDVVATDPTTNRVFAQLNQPGWIIPGTVSISDAAAVAEGHSGTVDAVFTVTLDAVPSPAATVSVDYDILSGTALEGEDFIDGSGTLTFTPGQTSKTVVVQIKGDRVGEADEDFVVRLTDSTHAEITDHWAAGIITDDEPRVWVVGGNSVVEGDSGTAPITFTATLSAASDAPVTVTFQTTNGTALGGADYVPATSTITFSPGQTTKTIAVQVNGDLVAEYEEYFYVNLTGATGALNISNSAIGMITDTDPDPTVSIANLTRAEGPPGTQTWFEFALALSTRSEKVISVRYSASGGSASSGGGNQDYFPEVNYANIYPGELYGSVTVRVVGDSRNESDETFFVNLSDPSGVTIADGQGVGTILTDETRGKTWIGPTSGGSWSTAGNWSPSGVPTATSLVRIVGASVTVSSSVTVSELTLDSYAALTVAPNGSRVLRTSGLFIDYHYSMLNLNDNDMIIDYSAAAGNISPLGGWNRWGYVGLAGMLAHGSEYGVQYNVGIATGQPDALAGLTTLGVGEASQILGLTGAQTTLFSGQTVDATTVLVKYTYGGDANLDGRINIDDYGQIDANVSKSGTVFGWLNGDFNYDGKINIDDYGIIDGNINQQDDVL